jgi:hypothetical protein
MVRVVASSLNRRVRRKIGALISQENHENPKDKSTKSVVGFFVFSPFELRD